MSTPEIAVTAEIAAQKLAGEQEALRPGAVSAVVLLTLCGFLSMFARVQLSGLLPLIKRDFLLTDAELGVLTGTAFSLMYATAALPLAWVSDRTNRSRFLTAALAFWSIMTAVSGFALSYVHLLLARIGLALGESVITPTAHSIIADYFPPKRRSLPIGIETSGIHVGVMVGLAVAGWAGGALGWRNALMLASAPGLIVAAAMLFWLKEPPRTQARPAAAAVEEPSRSALAILGTLWKNPPYRWLVLAGVLNACMTTGMGQWIPSFFVRSHHMSLAVAGASVGTALGLSAAAGSICGGWISSRAASQDLAAPFRQSIWFSLLVVPLLLTAVWAREPLIAMLGVAAWNFVGGFFFPIVFCGIQNTCDSRFRATASASAALFNVLIAYGLVPPAIGFLSDILAHSLGLESLRGALTATVLFPLASVFVYFRLSRFKYPEHERR